MREPTYNCPSCGKCLYFSELCDCGADDEEINWVEGVRDAEREEDRWRMDV